MSETTSKTFTCDLCNGSHGPHKRDAKPPQGWVRIDCGYTDGAGHYQDRDQDICFECLVKIEEAQKKNKQP